jgi:hypothetical protein
MKPTETPDLEALKYPIGKFMMPDKFDSSDIEEWIEIISSFPAQLKKAISGSMCWLSMPGIATIISRILNRR